MKLEPVAWLLRAKNGMVRCAFTKEPSEETREIAVLDGDTVTECYPPIPPGYVLVPVEPTEAMIDAWNLVTHWGNAQHTPQEVWKAMIEGEQ